ncbi:hypothetical protein [Tenuifilum thalassicum]|uniref:Porin family protein n=1 Tax=Tenuifilum thalassicum TaxID=2590900 RepID=A0A7D4BAM7_9BACT|nr:hypothetical protein [Tenuifilum thalassicum]QKG79500.1 hypothetical protein FHG85_04190 [Tenuifilum thalassicum]
MKRIAITLLVSFLSYSATCFAQVDNEKQSSKYEFNSGIGYINVPPAGSHGISMWVEGSKHLKTGFIMALKFQYAHANMRLGEEWDYLEGEYKPDIFYWLVISFSRPIRIANSQTIEPGIGFLYEKSYSWLPPLEFRNNQTVVLNDRFESVWEDLGLSFKVDYKYAFSNRVTLGIRAQVTYVTGMVEGIVVTPTFGFRF